MIRLIEQSLCSAILGMGYIERYGGIVRPVNIRQEADEGVFVDRIFPVSCGVTGTDCFDGGKYLDLVPDDQYKSVAYFEQRGGASLEQSTVHRKMWSGVEQVRFVCWLNYPALGLDDCRGPERFALATLAQIVGTRDFTVDGISGRLDISRASIAERDPAQVFGRYSYADKQWAFFWPYDFFAIDFTAKVTILGGCLEDVTLGEAVECVTTY